MESETTKKMQKIKQKSYKQLSPYSYLIAPWVQHSRVKLSPFNHGVAEASDDIGYC